MNDKPVSLSSGEPTPKPSFGEQARDTFRLLKSLTSRPKAPQSSAEQNQPPFFERHPRARRMLWQRKFLPAFWSIASVLSLVVNVILIVVLIILARQLFFLKSLVSDHLVGGLYSNFIKMDEATIKTTVWVSDTIQVNDTMAVVFNLPLQQDTTVILTQNTPIDNATIYLNGQPVPLDLTLPEGTQLGINLNMTVPVSQTIPVALKVPVNLAVPVNIPLNQTELHEPFVGLQQVVQPFYKIMQPLPNSWRDLCGPQESTLCDWFFGVR